jgi:four helix bundle protein
MTDNDKNDLQKRLFSFAKDIILLVRKLPKGKEYEVISYQLIKSATSSGANYEEAQGAVSKADFANKIGTSLKEMRESNYWIRIIIAVNEVSHGWSEMNNESSELMKILGKIYTKTSVKR